MWGMGWVPVGRGLRRRCGAGVALRAPSSPTVWHCVALRGRQGSYPFKARPSLRPSLCDTAQYANAGSRPALMRRRGSGAGRGIVVDPKAGAGSLPAARPASSRSWLIGINTDRQREPRSSKPRPRRSGLCGWSGLAAPLNAARRRACRTSPRSCIGRWRGLAS